MKLKDLIRKSRRYRRFDPPETNEGLGRECVFMTDPVGDIYRQ